MEMMLGTGKPLSPRRWGLIFFLLMVAMASHASERGGPVITVGNDPACDFTASSSNHGLAQAINAAAMDANGPGETLIRVANTGQYIGYQFAINVVSNQNVRIEGAYINCSSTTPTGPRTIVGPGSASFGQIFRVGSVPTPQTVFLSGFDIQGGDGSNGGALSVGNNNFVIASDLLIQNNNAVSGGGVSIVDSDDGTPTILWLLGDTTISNNDATLFGGGIDCLGEQAEVVLDTDVSVSLNTAGISGGGVSVRNGCEVNQYASFPDGVYSNLAGSGGGYAVSNGSRLTVFGGESSFFGFGDQTRRTTIDGNRASENGGAILLGGSGSVVRLTDASTVGNRADEDDNGTGNGGAIFVSAGARLEVDRTLGAADCHQPIRCSEFSGNEAVEGGAIYARGNDTEVDIRQTWFTLNRASEFGSVLYSSLDAGELPPDSVSVYLEGNAFVENSLPGNGEVIEFRFGNAVELRYSTFAANADSEFDASLSIGTSNVISFNGNAIDESDGLVFSGIWNSPTFPNSGQVNCSLARDFGPLPTFTANNFVGDPVLGSDYRPGLASPAVDVCTDTTAAPQEPDIAQALRGIDTAGVSNGPGPYDAGAFELQITTDAVFSDRFQSP